MKKLLLISSLIMFGLISVPAMADDDDNDSGECIVGLVNGMSLADEFGAAVPAITRCLKKTDHVKLIMQINKACRDTTVVSTNTGYRLENHARSCGSKRGYGIAQLSKMLKDYRTTHDISDKKIDLSVVVHGGGGTMLLDMPWNKLKPAVKLLIADGVKFYFCMNTVRGMAPKMGLTSAQLVSKVIPGVEYVTAGLTAIADFQEVGYNYIQP